MALDLWFSFTKKEDFVPLPSFCFCTLLGSSLLLNICWHLCNLTMCFSCVFVTNPASFLHDYLRLRCYSYLWFNSWLFLMRIGSFLYFAGLFLENKLATWQLYAGNVSHDLCNHNNEQRKKGFVIFNFFIMVAFCWDTVSCHFCAESYVVHCQLNCVFKSILCLWNRKIAVAVRVREIYKNIRLL